MGNDPGTINLWAPYLAFSLSLGEKLGFWLGIPAAVITIVQFLVTVVRRRRRKHSGYAAEVVDVHLSKKTVRPGGVMGINVLVRNAGTQPLGTFYGEIKIAPAYDLESPVHDTDRDLPQDEKRELQIRDMPRGTTQQLAYSWDVPKDLPAGVYYVSASVWNPQKLSGIEKNLCCFHKYGWEQDLDLDNPINHNLNFAVLPPAPHH